MLSDVVAVVGLFSRINWSWTTPGWEDVVSAGGFRLHEQVGPRRSYGLPWGVEADVFAVGNRIVYVEVTVDAFTESSDLDPLEYEDKVDEYYEKFRQAVELARPLLGEPLFCDGAAARGFPDDQDAEWLALWGLGESRLMIQQKHEDRELPFRICVVVAPGACGP